MMNKFYKFVNDADGAGTDLYVYGSLVDSKDEYWGDSTDIDFTDFKDTIDSMQSGETLNMFINSGGGSVFAASAMVSILNRAKEKGITINSYIDGICASAATYLAMVANTINVYRNSMMMIHKPMSMAMGNADDFRKEIETLDQIQNDVMLPLYRMKSKVSDAELNDMINAETWLSSAEIAEKFNVNLIDENKNVTASIDCNLFNRYKHVPATLTEQESKPADSTPIDYSEYEKAIAEITIRKGE